MKRNLLQSGYEMQKELRSQEMREWTKSMMRLTRRQRPVHMSCYYPSTQVMVSPRPTGNGCMLRKCGEGQYFPAEYWGQLENWFNLIHWGEPSGGQFVSGTIITLGDLLHMQLSLSKYLKQLSSVVYSDWGKPSHICRPFKSLMTVFWGTWSCIYLQLRFTTGLRHKSQNPKLTKIISLPIVCVVPVRMFRKMLMCRRFLGSKLLSAEKNLFENGPGREVTDTVAHKAVE